MNLYPKFGVQAINYYENAVKTNPRNTQLRHDLAELYTKLKKFDEAEKLLKETLTNQKDTADYYTLINEVKIYLLMYKVHHGIQFE